MEVVRFWCREVARDVEVTFDEGAIVSCSAFETSTEIVCRRTCVDTMYRLPGAPPEVVIR